MTKGRHTESSVLQESQALPFAGRVRRLTDPDVQAKVDAMLRDLESDPAKALQYLKDKGFLTPTGRRPKKYGG